MAGWVAGAIVGSSLIGAGAASSASDAQAEAAKYAADLQYKMYSEGVDRQKPFLGAGYRLSLIHI